MPQVDNLYALIVLLALLAAGIIMFVLGQPTWGALLLGTVIGGGAIKPPVSLKKP